jgi:hypothetical protein
MKGKRYPSAKRKAPSSTGWLWITLGILLPAIIGLITAPLWLRFILKPGLCQVDSIGLRKASVQSNNMYSQVFRDRSCAPKRMVLKVPVIQKLPDLSAQLGKVVNSPEIATILTISNDSQSFHIRRVDQSGSSLNVSSGDTCVAWKWSEKGQEETLTLSLERNLQIHDPKIKKVIFIVSLPIEFKQAETILSVQRSVLEGSGNNRAGGIFQVNLRDISPNLFKALDLKDMMGKRHWISSTSVSRDISEELVDLTKQIGVYVDFPVNEIKDKSDEILSYEKLSEEISCEIPRKL